ncbi:hypothetical protein TSAR_012311 [Trichomalopsis sarcophagae]|uniref:DDE Tnp4 domain-containing protein n=1 Tax=Trichomalopsis sarcophagae TaxID=543379 RepID=A0A232ELM3_9HYME|nr:hypothetical protein TSAR_012311 [Trichomalopsis sarcophagae]
MDNHLYEYLLGIYEDEEVERQRRRQQFQQLKLERRMLRDTSNVFAMCPNHFRKYYRFTPEVALRLIRDIEHELIGARDSAIQSHIQVLSVLRFLAEGSYQKGFCQDFMHPISQPSASRFITKVINAINNVLAEQYLHFPSTEQERENIQQSFRRTIRVPGIIGLIDCFVICITRPSQNEEAFYHYRHGHGLIAQIIVDSNYNILNIRICPGSNNDRYVWQLSQAREYIESLRNYQPQNNYYILGDSGYTLSPVLLTPILDAAEGTPEAAYTYDHVRTRCRVEQTIGMFTNIWRVIKRARKLLYQPQKFADIVNACAILYNYRRRHGIVDDPVLRVAPRNRPVRNHNMDYPAGIAERNRIIQEYYR